MVRLIVTATLVALMMHAAVGCCLHSAHTAATTCGPTDSASLCNDCHGESHGTAGEHTVLGVDTHDGDSHEQPGDCKEFECVFASGGKRLPLVSPLLVVTQATPTATAGLIVPPVGCLDSSASRCGASSTAIYVVHQRLLI